MATIYSSTFQNCSSLTDVRIPNKITRIGSYVFSGCSSLKSITIPGSVATISEYAFRNCSSLTGVVFLGSAPYFVSDCFEGVVPGKYILTVRCDGGVPRDHPVTLAIGENIMDVVLLRPGDVNGDHALDIGDVSMIYAHNRGTTLPEGYPLKCADVNGDGEVTIVDVAIAYRQSKGDL